MLVVRDQNTLKWKYRKLIEFAKSEKYHIIMIQETRSPDINYIYKSVADIPDLTVFEAINYHNANKGGVAVIAVDPDINLQLIATDAHCDWTEKLNARDKNKIEMDNVHGKWIHTTFDFFNDGKCQTVNLINVYAPKDGFPNQAFFKHHHKRWKNINKNICGRLE